MAIGTLGVFYSGVDGLGGFKLFFTLSTAVLIEWHRILSFLSAGVSVGPCSFVKDRYPNEAFAVLPSQL